MNNQTIVVAVIALIIGGLSGYVIADKAAPDDVKSYEKETSDNIPMGMHRMPDGTIMGDADADMGQMDHMMEMMVSSER